MNLYIYILIEKIFITRIQASIRASGSSSGTEAGWRVDDGLLLIELVWTGSCEV